MVFLQQLVMTASVNIFSKLMTNCCIFINPITRQNKLLTAFLKVHFVILTNKATFYLPKSLGCPVQIPTGLPTVSCRINSQCTSLHCCLNLDLKVTQLSSKAWLEIDPCDFKLSVGMGMWYFNISLFSYEWGKMERFSIGRAINVE